MVIQYLARHRVNQIKNHTAQSLLQSGVVMCLFWSYMGYKQILMWRFLGTLRSNWCMPFVSLHLWPFLDLLLGARGCLPYWSMKSWPQPQGWKSGELKEAWEPEGFVEQNLHRTT